MPSSSWMNLKTQPAPIRVRLGKLYKRRKKYEPVGARIADEVSGCCCCCCCEGWGTGSQLVIRLSVDKWRQQRRRRRRQRRRRQPRRLGHLGHRITQNRNHLIDGKFRGKFCDVGALNIDLEGGNALLLPASLSLSLPLSLTHTHTHTHSETLSFTMSLMSDRLSAHCCCDYF